MKRYYQTLGGIVFRVKDVRKLLAIREGEFHYSFIREDKEDTSPMPIDYVAVIKAYGWLHIGRIDYEQLCTILLGDSNE